MPEEKKETIEKKDINTLSAVYKLKMPDTVFEKLSSFIYTQYGIKMPIAKKIMLQSRLQRRLRELNLNSYEEYCDYVFSKEGDAMEVVQMIDVVTTNKTEFFREPAHFDFLQQTILPEFMHKNKNGATMKVWSAGCSSGEEVYTLAILFSEFKEDNRRFDFSIFGSDISTRILASAIDAVYREERAANISMDLKRKYFLRSKDRTKPTVRVVPELRKKTYYDRLNFMDQNYDKVKESFDIIFCRNVLIYFDRPTQENVINKLCTKLKPGGYFFLGHSESITGLNVPLVQLKPTVFMRTV
ncbi:MAG: CheR family methyltransferase [Bacteroidota bacterium]